MEGNVPAGLARLARGFLLALATVVGLGICYMIFDWRERATSPTGIVFFYALPAFVLGVLVWAARRGGEVALNLALLMVFTTLPALAIELGAGWFARNAAWYGLSEEEVRRECPGGWSINEICHVHRARGLPFDVRLRTQVVEEMRRDGVDAWPNLYAGLFAGGYLRVGDRRVRPIGGLPGVRTVFCNERGSWVDYVADAHGFNNTGLAAEDGDVSVLLVGDSFTQGRCIDPTTTIQARLTQQFGKSVSLGIDGNGPFQQLAALREYGPAWQPPVVLWMFYEGNDLRDMERDRDDPFLTAYFDPSHRQGLLESADEIGRALADTIMTMRLVEEAVELERSERLFERRAASTRTTLWSLLSLQRIRRTSWDFVNGAARAEPDPFDDDLYRELLTTARNLVDGWGGELVFVYLPEWGRISGSDAAMPHRDAMLELVRGLDVDIMDATPVLMGHEDPLSLFPLGLSGHYNEAGYALVADGIADFIGER